MTSVYISRIAAAFVISYLLGSLNFGIIISKLFYHQDIRNFGSGNAGTTNMLRTFGKKAAAFTVVFDILKGTVAVIIAKMLFRAMPYAADYSTYSVVAMLAQYAAVCGALVGHLKPVYFGFRGGKGVTVAFGAMVAVEPLLVTICLLIFIAILLKSRIVSLSSIIAASAFTALTIRRFVIKRYFSPMQFIVATVFPGAIVWAHRANIKRLLNGTEYRFGEKH